MLLPVLAAAAFFCLTAALAPPGACASSSDCSLNGDCVSGSCVCDVGWSGSPACDVLRLAPSAPMSGYRNTSGASWGGRPVYDAGLWHLLVAQMRNNCSLWTWKNNSAIVHATSTTPDGPYQYVDEIVPPFAHNPKLYKVPVWDGGGFVLASIGGGLWRPEPQICSQPWADGDAPGQWRHARVRAADTPAPNEGGGDPASPTEDGCGPEPPLNGGCGITLSWAATMAGPWSAPAPLIIVDQNRSALLDCAHTNPSLAWRRNARGVRMGFNAGYCHDGLETIGVAQAQSWRGPWTLATPDPVLFDSPGVPHHCEDPVIWESDRGWHMIVHNVSRSVPPRHRRITPPPLSPPLPPAAAPSDLHSKTTRGASLCTRTPSTASPTGRCIPRPATPAPMKSASTTRTERTP